MRRAFVIGAALVLAAAGLYGDGTAANFYYEPGGFGFCLPESAVVSEDEDGNTWYGCEDTGFFAFVANAGKLIKNADLLNAGKFTAALKELGATVTQLKSYVPEGQGSLVYNSALVSMEWDDGSVNPGMAILVNSSAAPGATFFVGFFSPDSAIDPNNWDDPAVIAADSFTSSRPGEDMGSY